jgi:hypothetical protein
MVNFNNLPKVRKPAGGHTQKHPLTKAGGKSMPSKSTPVMSGPKGAHKSYLPARLPNPDQNPAQAFSRGGSVQAPRMNKVVSCKNF